MNYILFLTFGLVLTTPIFAAEKSYTVTNKTYTLIYMGYENKDKTWDVCGPIEPGQQQSFNPNPNSKKIMLHIGSIINSTGEVTIPEQKSMILKVFAASDLWSNSAIGIIQDDKIVAKVNV